MIKHGVACITLSDFLCEQANPRASKMSEPWVYRFDCTHFYSVTYVNRNLFAYRLLSEFDSDMAPCVKDGALAFWCCTENMIKKAYPGNFVYSSHVTHGVYCSAMCNFTIYR